MRCSASRVPPDSGILFSVLVPLEAMGQVGELIPVPATIGVLLNVLAPRPPLQILRGIVVLYLINVAGICHPLRGGTMKRLANQAMYENLLIRSVSLQTDHPVPLRVFLQGQKPQGKLSALEGHAR